MNNTTKLINPIAIKQSELKMRKLWFLSFKMLGFIMKTIKGMANVNAENTELFFSMNSILIGTIVCAKVKNNAAIVGATNLEGVN